LQDAPPLQTLGSAALLIEEAIATIRWNDGLRDLLVEIVMRSADEAEKLYGPSGGAFKRQFVIDVTTRVLVDDYLDLPVPRQLEEVIAPLMGIFVDWTVEVLNDCRGPVWFDTVAETRRPRRVSRFGTSTLQWWKAIRWLMRVYAWLQRLLRSGSRYERKIRAVAASLDKSRKTIERLLPPSSLFSVALKIGHIVVELGALTKPYIRTVAALLRIAIAEGGNLADSDARHELLVAALQEFLAETYVDDPFMLGLIQSGIGTFVIGEQVRGVELLLEKLGQLPTFDNPPESSRAPAWSAPVIPQAVVRSRLPRQSPN
jgi:hypothetical protein